MIKEAIPLLLTKELPRIAQEPINTSHTKNDIKNIGKLNLSESKKVKNTINYLRGLTTNNLNEAAYYEKDRERYIVRIEIQKEDKITK